MPEIEHVVLVEWAGEQAAAAEQADALVDRHLTLIDGIVRADRGTSVSTEQLEGGFHWMLAVRFRDVAARDAYLPHPEHQPVAAFLQSRAHRLVVFDVAAR
jgi:hypothetical protein